MVTSTAEQWRFTGSVAEFYEQYSVPAGLGPWGADLVELAKLQPGERVLDVACGTGAVTRAIVPKVGAQGQVFAVDISADMLAVARRAVPDPRIDWREADATALPLADAAFNVVMCQHGLQYVSDRKAALGEMLRVLVPGGRLILAVWGPIEHNPNSYVLSEALTRHVGAEAGTLLRTVPFVLADSDELAVLVRDEGFRNVTVRPFVKQVHLPPAPELLRIALALGPLGAMVAEKGPAAYAAVCDELTAGLRDFVDGDGLTVPTEVLVATAVR